MLLAGVLAARPGLIVRAVDASCDSGDGCSGLATTNSAAAEETVEADACRAAMGAAYPVSEFFG